LIWDIHHDRYMWMIQSDKWFTNDLGAYNMQDAKVLYWTYACIQVFECQVWSKKSIVWLRLWYSYEYIRYQVKW